MKMAADASLPKRHAEHDKKGISDDLYELILLRGRHLKEGKYEEMMETDKDIQKRKRKEKKGILPEDYQPRIGR